MKKLPREIQIMILKIKTRKAVIERLEKILKFPVFDYKACSQNFHDYIITEYFRCGKRQSWLITEQRRRTNNRLVKRTIISRFLNSYGYQYKHCEYKE